MSETLRQELPNSLDLGPEVTLNSIQSKPSDIQTSFTVRMPSATGPVFANLQGTCRDAERSPSTCPNQGLPRSADRHGDGGDGHGAGAGGARDKGLHETRDGGREEAGVGTRSGVLGLWLPHRM